MKKTLLIIAIIAIIAVVGVVLVACDNGGDSKTAPESVEAAQAKMEAAGYSVRVINNSIIATKGENYLTANFYTDEQLLQETYKEMNAAAQDGLINGYQYGKVGKWLYCAKGTEAINAFFASPKATDNSSSGTAQFSFTSMNAVQRKLEAAGYVVNVTSNSLIATKGGDSLTATLFSTEQEAQIAYDAYASSVTTGYARGKDGKIVYYGTTAAVNILGGGNGAQGGNSGSVITNANAPTSLNAARTKMESVGYRVEIYEENLSAYKGNDGIAAELFSTTQEAQEACNQFLSLYGSVEGVITGVAGKWFYYGTNAAVDAFLK